MLGIAVPGKLCFPRVLRSDLLFKLRLIAAPSFAHFLRTALFHYIGPFRQSDSTIKTRTSIRIISKLRRHIDAPIQAVIQVQGGFRVVNVFT